MISLDSQPSIYFLVLQMLKNHKRISVKQQTLPIARMTMFKRKTSGASH